MPATPQQPYGTVVSPTGVNERQFPSTDSAVVGHLPHNAEVALRCKVRAQNVDGNDIWYLLRERQVWVAARFVRNTGEVPYCGDVSADSGEPSADSAG
ncbi:SH3 domain-containing protein [Streptomyces sp. NPDC052396]|uniref:SH3 domain-containing protein n=1 Tax=Streptomyces sp. NPDC052396 TaxID=3365689 RepID=UPI0037D3B975